MVRLPTPGQDDGKWGEILNNFLSVEHNSDGTLKSVARPSDVSSGVSDGTITDAKVASNANIAKSKLAPLNIGDSDIVSAGLTNAALSSAAGVTAAQLASSVQTSLGKADSALQSADIAGKANKTSVASNIRTITSAAVTAVAGDVLLVDATAAAVTVTLPVATAGSVIIVKKTDNSANTVTITGVIDGTTNPILKYQYGSLEIIADGTNWQRVVRPSLGALVDTSTGSVTDGQMLSYQASSGKWIPATPASSGGAPLLVPRITRPKTRTLLPGVNSYLGAGHSWVLGGGSLDSGNSNLNDTTDIALGDRSIKLQTGGAGSTGAWASLTRVTAQNLTGKFIRVWFKIDQATAGNLFRVGLYFGSGASAFTNQINQYILDYTSSGGQMQQYAKPGEWVSYTINPAGCASVTGTIDWTAIQDFRFRVEDLNAGQPAVVHFGGLEFISVDSAYPNGVISLTFDDCYANQYLNARPKMDQYGYPGTVYAIEERLDTAGNLSTTQLRALAELSDWDIGLHSNTNAVHSATDGYVSATPSVLRADWDAQRSALQTLGLLRGMNHVAYPQGKFDSVTLTEVKKRFASARTTISRSVETLPVGDPFRLRAIQCGNTTTLGPNSTVGSLEWLVDQIFTYGGWLILCFHDIPATQTNTTEFSVANFGTLIDYIATKGVPVRTMGEVLGV